MPIGFARAVKLLPIRGRYLLDGCLAALLALTIALVALWYVSRDQNYYWWVDWWARTVGLSDLARRDPQAAWRQVQSSLAWERNSLYSLPLIPVLWLGGESRQVYTLGLGLIYFWPFCLVMGAIATQIIPKGGRSLFWATAFLTVLIPVNWLPTLLGIPDTGGATLIGLATWVYLRQGLLKRIWSAVAIGGLIVAALLLRRHFSYSGMALLGAMLLQMGWPAVRRLLDQPHRGGRLALKTIIYLGLVGLTIVLLLRLVAWEFTYQALTKDYRNLYASWTMPIADMLHRYLGFYGAGTWMLAIGGWSVGLTQPRWQSSRLHRPSLIGLGLMALASLVIWLVGLRYGNVFYALHITPFVMVGLVLVGWSLPVRMRWIIVIYAIGNWSIAFLPVELPLRPLFGFEMAPIVRSDQAELRRLVNYLHDVAPAGQPIYVVGHQRLQLSASLLRAVEEVENRPTDPHLNLIAAPQIDSQDAYPLSGLLQAEYVVLPDHLLQYPGRPDQVPVAGEWVLPQETDVGQVVLNAFRQKWEIAQDFERSPFQFQLDYRTTVAVYRRRRPTSLPTAIRSLHLMQQQIGDRPGGQLDWLSLEADTYTTQVNLNLDKTYRLVRFPPSALQLPLRGDRLKRWLPLELAQRKTAHFLYIGALPAQMQITGWLKLWTPPCRGSTLTFKLVDTAGQTRSTTLPIATRGMSRFERFLSAPPNPTRANPLPNANLPNPYVLMQVSSENSSQDFTESCTVDVNKLVVAPNR